MHLSGTSLGRWTWLSVLAHLASGCGDPLPTQPPPGPDTGNAYSLPAVTADGWEVALPTTVDVDSTYFLRLVDDLADHPEHAIHGIVVARHGALVFERYFRGGKLLSPGNTTPVQFDRDSTHFMASVTKSAVSMAMGIIIDRGQADLGERVFDIFPDLRDMGGDGREHITLEHLISMRAGLEWDESTYPFGDPRNHLTKFTISDDPVRFVMGLPLVTAPGTAFHYNSGATNVLGEVVRRAATQRMDSLLAEHIFQPLGITTWRWELVAGDVVFGSSGLHIRPRDMAKLGQLYANRGAWRGTHLLSEDWIASSTTARSHMQWGWADGYAMGWWTNTYETAAHGPVRTFAALGWGEQAIVVAPELGLVMAMTAGMYDGIPWKRAMDVFSTYVLPSAR